MKRALLALPALILLTATGLWAGEVRELTWSE
ncbi:DUF3299 domain-containing protein, partial [Pseudomonas sp. 57B-090624]